MLVLNLPWNLPWCFFSFLARHSEETWGNFKIFLYLRWWWHDGGITVLSSCTAAPTSGGCVCWFGNQIIQELSSVWRPRAPRNWVLQARVLISQEQAISSLKFAMIQAYGSTIFKEGAFAAIFLASTRCAFTTHTHNHANGFFYWPFPEEKEAQGSSYATIQLSSSLPFTSWSGTYYFEARVWCTDAFFKPIAVR